MRCSGFVHITALLCHNVPQKSCLEALPYLPSVGKHVFHWIHLHLTDAFIQSDSVHSAYAFYPFTKSLEIELMTLMILEPLYQHHPFTKQHLQTTVICNILRKYACQMIYSHDWFACCLRQGEVSSGLMQHSWEESLHHRNCKINERMTKKDELGFIMGWIILFVLTL